MPRISRPPPPTPRAPPAAPAPPSPTLRIPFAPETAESVNPGFGARPPQTATIEVPELEAEVLSRVALRFTTPFGDGADRHDVVRAASAIVPFRGGWLIAQDDSNLAAAWRGGEIRPIRLFARSRADTFSEARGNKADKPDLECGVTLSVDGEEVAVFFGSGSTAKRTRAVVIDDEGATPVAMGSLYRAAMGALGVDAASLNIEGAAVLGDRVRFFQRGNGGGVNASFDVPLAALRRVLDGGRPFGADEVIDVRRHALGTLDGVPLGFSAATALPDGRVLFAASAEQTKSTYDDGATAGSIIGLLGPDHATIARWRVPEAGLKLEGLAVESIDGDRVHVIAVSDQDDPSTPSLAFRLSLTLPR